jgi:SET domain
MHNIISNNSIQALAKIEQLETHLLKMPQTECPVVHHFMPGIYMRQVTIPADTYSIGHYQKTRHTNIMLTGKVSMINEQGQIVKLCAPQVFESGPGRKIGYIHEEMIWINVYVTPETDVEKLESLLLEKSEPFLLHQQQLALINTQINISDYDQMLADIGISAELVWAQSENPDDQIPFPVGAYKVQIADSAIHGKGCFATGSFNEEEVIATARIKGKRTPAGRFINHSRCPNAKMVLCGNDINVVAIRQIRGNLGGQLGEEITVDYRQAVAENLKGAH